MANEDHEDDPKRRENMEAAIRACMSLDIEQLLTLQASMSAYIHEWFMRIKLDREKRAELIKAQKKKAAAQKPD